MTPESQSLQFISTDFKIGKKELITKSLLMVTKSILNHLFLSELDEKVHVPLLPQKVRRTAIPEKVLSL
jgi:hypothetical protein